MIYLFQRPSGGTGGTPFEKSTRIRQPAQDCTTHNILRDMWIDRVCDCGIQCCHRIGSSHPLQGSR